MQKKIATLEIWYDSANVPSGSGRRSDGTYRITMTPGGDIPIDTRDKFQTALAHELGHFVALLTKDETHDPANQFYHRLTGDSSSLIPGELKAWALAKKISPDLDKTFERECIASYERSAQ
jgi:hypothetical protein